MKTKRFKPVILLMAAFVISFNVSMAQVSVTIDGNVSNYEITDWNMSATGSCSASIIENKIQLTAGGSYGVVELTKSFDLLHPAKAISMDISNFSHTGFGHAEIRITLLSGTSKVAQYYQHLGENIGPYHPEEQTSLDYYTINTSPDGSYTVSFDFEDNIPSGVTSSDLDTVDRLKILVQADTWTGGNYINYGIGEFIVTTKGEIPDYIIALIDIKPGSCPNPLNINAAAVEGLNEDSGQLFEMSAKIKPEQTISRRGVLPVAILGTADFNVSDINPATITLEGVSIIRSAPEDVASPVYEPTENCECNTLGPDGYMDLTLKFDQTLIVEALGDMAVGDIIPLTISGELFDGTPFEGSDCVVIVGNPNANDVAVDDNEIVAGRDGLDQMPTTFELLQNIPNPFNPITEISFSLPVASRVSLEVYNITGQRVASIADGQFEAGNHSVIWDASKQASGIYFYRLKAGEFAETRKMILLK